MDSVPVAAGTPSSAGYVVLGSCAGSVGYTLVPSGGRAHDELGLPRSHGHLRPRCRHHAKGSGEVKPYALAVEIALDDELVREIAQHQSPETDPPRRGTDVGATTRVGSDGERQSPRHPRGSTIESGAA